MIQHVIVGAKQASDGEVTTARGGSGGEQIVSMLRGRYGESSLRQNVFMAQAIVTAPVIWTTEAGTGGPLLWNSPSNRVRASILAVGFGVTTVATVAAALGLTGGSGQTAAPTSTTAIDSEANLYVGGAAAACNAYRVGTTGTNSFFFPFADLHTGALTVDNAGMRWVDLGGLVTVPPGSFVSVAASATATTAVIQSCLIWEEIPF